MRRMILTVAPGTHVFVLSVQAKQGKREEPFIPLTLTQNPLTHVHPDRKEVPITTLKMRNNDKQVRHLRRKPRCGCMPCWPR
jgi:hypothetical protein